VGVAGLPGSTIFFSATEMDNAQDPGIPGLSNRPARRSRARWLAVPITLGVFSLLTAGYLSSFTPATIIDDGRAAPIEVRTLQTTVDGALRDAGVTLRPEDVVEPARDAQIVRGEPINIKRARMVRVTIDGQDPRLVRTQRNSARDLLNDIGYSFGLFDTLRINGEFVEALPGLSTPATRNDTLQFDLDRPVAEIDVRRARPIWVEEAGVSPAQVNTTASTVGEALLQAGYLVYLADKISPDPGMLLQPEMRISITRAKPVSVLVDGRRVRTRTHAATVADVLTEMNIILLDRDYTRPALSDAVNPDTEIRVVRVTRDLLIRQDPIPFSTRWEANPDMEIDTQGKTQDGTPGIREERTEVVLEDGNVIQSDVVANFVARDPQDTIYSYGTRIVVRALDTPNGTLQYWRKIRVLATSYSASTAGVSRSVAWYGKARCGQDMRRGIVAVDPRLIPLGTQIYVEGYGVGLACDTGSAIIGKRIDLGYGDTDLELWYRWVDVYVLTPVPASPRYRLE
jgi:resuscitation-promoting factor RpfB